MGNLKDIQSDLKAAAEAAFAVGGAEAILSAIKPLVGSMRADDTHPAYVNGVDEKEATADRTYDADDYLGELIARAHVPDGFALDAAGVNFLTEDGIPVLISSPLIIKALSRSFDGKGWSLVVLVVDPDGNVHELLVPLCEVSGNFTAARRRLIAHGLRLTPGKKSSAALATYMLTATPTQRIRQVDAPGWHGTAYLFGTTAIGDCGGEELRLKDPSQANPLVQTGGSPEGWQMLAALLLGNRRLMFSVCFALSGALLWPTRTESGGVHYYSTSTFGKTTTCIIAGSVVGGGGDKGFIGEWNGSGVSQEGRFAMANDSVVISDEIGMRIPMIPTRYSEMMPTT